MENKKQLIIIPPMSEALRKLNEVLEGISAEENMEITIIDDLKELTQFLGSTGQCLILASNAKKCATFLQDNKAMIAKLHCKTILFTPKEIPAKTLVKFTKVGLTESILESSPPKTFVYKVKLLLRSIKTVKPQEDAEKIVKSLDTTKTMAEEAEKDVKEKAVEASDSFVDPTMPEKKKFEDSGETIDYGTNLKGKNKHQEEAIDTNWRSDRKRDEFILEEAEKEKKSSESDPNNIDMYYRGKQQKNVDLFADEDPYARAKREDVEESLDVTKKRRAEAEIYEEGALRQKRLETEEEALADEKKAIIQTDLDLSVDKREKEITREEEERKDPNYGDLSADPETEKKNKGVSTDINLEGALKGKVNKPDEEAEDEIELDPEMDYMSARKKDKKTTELDLDGADKDYTEKKEDEALDADKGQIGLDDESGPSHMGGKEGQVDKIETMMTSKFDPSSELNPEEENKDLDLESKKTGLDAEGKDLRQESLLDGGDLGKDLEDAPNLLREDDSSPTQKKSSFETQLERENALREKEAQEEKDEKDHANSPLLENSKDQKEREKTIKDDEKELGLRSLDKNDPLAKKERDHTHNGPVEKIDTFYRGGDAKKNEQNWDDLHKKNASIELLVSKSTRAPDGTLAKENKDLGEVTIDYRKLKEEFDMIASGEAYKGEDGISGKKANSQKDDEDDGSFKVIEIDSRSLDFAVHVINAIYEKEMKPKKVFALLATEILGTYHAFPVFYTYKLSEKKFNETYNVFTEPSNDLRITGDIKDWWHEHKKDSAIFEHYQSKSMTTWRCAEIIKEDAPWEDVELPTWAEQELKTKKVELIFPYFDGIDRMGMAVVFFPEGLDPKKAMGLLTLLEMARTLFLDTIERYQVKPTNPVMDEAPIESKEEVSEKKNVLSFFNGLFGKKKAG